MQLFFTIFIIIFAPIIAAKPPNSAHTGGFSILLKHQIHFRGYFSHDNAKGSRFVGKEKIIENSRVNVSIWAFLRLFLEI